MIFTNPVNSLAPERTVIIECSRFISFSSLFGYSAKKGDSKGDFVFVFAIFFSSPFGYS